LLIRLTDHFTTLRGSNTKEMNLYTCTKSLVLASSSPRRRELLSDLGIKFSVLTADADESVIAGESPQQMVGRLAELKARIVAEQLKEAAWVLGADTTVVLDGEILGKPLSSAEAIQTLTKLSGRSHQVWGGVALLERETNGSITTRSLERYCTTVTMRRLEAPYIERYVATGDPMDKAGAYAIQGFGAQMIEKIEGSYTNVVGLDIAAVLKTLVHFEVVRCG
jgi:septum formation protein